MPAWQALLSESQATGSSLFLTGSHTGNADGGLSAPALRAGGQALAAQDSGEKPGDKIKRIFASIEYEDGEKRYILAPQGLTDGMTVMNGEKAEIRVGNCLPLSAIPVGTQVHNIELKPGKGGQMVRSAGTSAQLMAKEGKYVTLRLPSGEMRMVPLECRDTIGVIGNIDHNLINYGKAGRKRHMGIRPTVRGSVMNPNDHPHGGGEGKAPIGRPGPSTPWGKPALGYKTRKKKASDKLIVRRRGAKK